jgi:hypothetical protein
MEKELENPGKKKKAISTQTSPSGLVPRVPAAPDRRTPPVSGSPLSRAPSLSLSLAAQWGRSVGAGLLRPLALPLSLFRGPGLPVPSRCPERPSFLSLRRGPSLSDPPSSRPPWTSACALAHVAGFLGHDACPRA